MTVSTSAFKYARALVEVAVETGEEKTVLGQIEQFAELYSASNELRAAATSPSLPLDVKNQIVGAIAKKAGFSKIVRNFLFVLLERSRLGQIVEIVAAYREVLDEREGIVRVEVISASPLSESHKTRLEAKMVEVTGFKVRLNFSIDESVIGGMKLQFGSTVLDGTIQSRLQQLGRQLSVG